MDRIKIHKTLGKDVNIALNIKKSNTQVGLGETINKLVEEETEKSINPFQDTEQIAYKTTNSDGFNINFRFLNRTTNNFQTSYEAVGFNTVTGLTKNSFTKSFFRLYFYDSNDLNKRNLVSFEELDVIGTIEPRLKLKRIFWPRNDKELKDTFNNKSLYVIGRFFNAANGKVYDFMNLPLTYTSPITINDYSQNSDWWTSPITLINPNINGGNHNIAIQPFVGANLNDTITLTEQIIL